MLIEHHRLSCYLSARPTRTLFINLPNLQHRIRFRCAEPSKGEAQKPVVEAPRIEATGVDERFPYGKHLRRGAVTAFRLKYATLAPFGLTKYAPSWYLLQVEAPTNCHAAQAVDWSPVWNSDGLAPIPAPKLLRSSKAGFCGSAARFGDDAPMVSWQQPGAG